MQYQPQTSKEIVLSKFFNVQLDCRMDNAHRDGPEDFDIHFSVPIDLQNENKLSTSRLEAGQEEHKPINTCSSTNPNVDWYWDPLKYPKSALGSGTRSVQEKTWKMDSSRKLLTGSCHVFLQIGTGSRARAWRKTTRDAAAVTLSPSSRKGFVEQPVSGLYTAAAYYTATGGLNYPDPSHSRLAPFQSISRKTRKRFQRSLAPRPKRKKTVMSESVPRENLKQEEDRVQAVSVNKQKEVEYHPSERSTVQKLAKVRTPLTGSVPKGSMNRFRVQAHSTKASFQPEQHAHGVDRNSLTLMPEVGMPASPISSPSQLPVLILQQLREGEDMQLDQQRERAQQPVDERVQLQVDQQVGMLLDQNRQDAERRLLQLKRQHDHQPRQDRGFGFIPTLPRRATPLNKQSPLGLILAPDDPGREPPLEVPRVNLQPPSTMRPVIGTTQTIPGQASQVSPQSGFMSPPPPHEPRWHNTPPRRFEDYQSHHRRVREARERTSSSQSSSTNFTA